MSEEWTEADDAIEEVWEIRRQIWERCGNDPEKVIAYYLELEKQHVGPRVEPPQKGKSAA
ncbi:MAG TPA: hypothetical protein VLK84_19515 [Longimicrobium sp.]|nr:hypothetical protein [Longimicrobium sp.]